MQSRHASGGEGLWASVQLKSFLVTPWASFLGFRRRKRKLLLRADYWCFSIFVKIVLIIWRCVGICTPECRCQKDQQRAPDFPKLELQVVVSHCMQDKLGIWLRASAKVICVGLTAEVSFQPWWLSVLIRLEICKPLFPAHILSDLNTSDFNACSIMQRHRKLRGEFYWNAHSEDIGCLILNVSKAITGWIGLLPLVPRYVPGCIWVQMRNY